MEHTRFYDRHRIDPCTLRELLSSSQAAEDSSHLAGASSPAAGGEERGHEADHDIADQGELLPTYLLRYLVGK